MPNDRYYISFREFLMDRNNEPIFFKPVLFEVLEENNETVTVRLLEDHQLILEERLEAERLELEAKIKGFPKAGQEYIISRRHRQNKDILNELRSGNVVAYYVDKLDLPNKKFYFGGTFFPYDHPSVKK